MSGNLSKPNNFPSSEVRPSRSTRSTGNYLIFSSIHSEKSTTDFHAAFQSSVQQKGKIHRKDLPPLPRFWSDLNTHSLGKEFKNAGKLEWDLLHETKTFFFHPMPRDQATSKPLSLTWAFAYNRAYVFAEICSHITIMILRQPKALYGLRRSPLLWQKELSSTFKTLDLDQSIEESCIYFNNTLFVFFLILYLFQQFITQLRSKYDLTDRGTLSSFLGVRIIRDRIQKELWLTQDSYIDLVANAFNLADDNSMQDCPFHLPPAETFAKGYFIRLFGRAIAWSAKKQNAATTSSTEAELLAFTFTAKELISTLRLLQNISIKLDQPIPQIECDNKQTIRLASSDIPKICL
ncbi:unnamed protein product [Blumeria hordei]|uniref:Reverse transcriptase Ty1/copia-type domain-containing protein n=1 Tax=Blumeria hordei TaxID=2867405 RepID=A0A383UYB7_BLUHO|nr:unnamed protein product [Blumeria hordei]